MNTLLGFTIIYKISNTSYNADIYSNIDTSEHKLEYTSASYGYIFRSKSMMKLDGKPMSLDEIQLCIKSILDIYDLNMFEYIRINIVYRDKNSIIHRKLVDKNTRPYIFYIYTFALK